VPNTGTEEPAGNSFIRRKHWSEKKKDPEKRGGEGTLKTFLCTESTQTQAGKPRGAYPPSEKDPTKQKRNNEGQGAKKDFRFLGTIEVWVMRSTQGFGERNHSKRLFSG